MKTKGLIIFSIAVLAFACSKVPISGRKQLNLLPASTVNSMSLTEYKKFLSTAQVVTLTDSQAVMVQTVGKRIADAASAYLRSHGAASRVGGYKWEFNLVNDATANAWCMPGGKVVVYTGLLPITKDANGLAVVLAHEISHAIANHGNERMSQQMGVALGGMALDVALSQKPQQTRDIFLQSYGLGSTLGVLGYSRLHESEADHLGLLFMAMAGYDPNGATAFWTRMKAQGGAQPVTFLSTHPSHETRIADIKKWLPEALKYYKPVTTTTTTTTPKGGSPKGSSPKGGSLKGGNSKTTKP